MKAFFELIRNEWPRYLIEIFVIIIGITLSFLLNEWRVDRDNRANEIRLLEALHASMTADSTAIIADMQFLKNGIEIYPKVLKSNNLENLPDDSLLQFFFAISAYATFSGQDIAYEEMRQSGGYQLMSNKALLQQIVKMYSFTYDLIQEWCNIDKNFILNRMLPYQEVHFQSHNVFDPSNLISFWKLNFNNAIKTNQFRNLLSLNIQFKSSVLYAFKQLQKELRANIRAVKEELARLR